MNYYNEFDPKAAAWLLELIAEGLIPPGDVDERSITDVRSDELLGYTQCHFFAGIGGWSLALRLIGWPDDRPVWTGSCPCQAFSTAGKQRGFDDDRDLWPDFFRLIAECRPEYVFGEQVENAIRHGWLDRVYADLEEEGYAVGAVVLGAHSVGSPHRRQRLYWGACDVADSDEELHDRCRESGTLRGTKYSDCGADGGVDDVQGFGRGILDASNLGASDGEVDTPSDADYSGGGVGNPDRPGLERRSGGGGGSSEFPARPDGMAGLSPWYDFKFIYCKDHKVRRIPAESLLFGLADGVSEGMDGIGVVGVSEDGGFPLTTQKEGRAMLLKGYGNAINPYCATAFIKGFMEALDEKSL